MENDPPKLDYESRPPPRPNREGWRIGEFILGCVVGPILLGPMAMAAGRSGGSNTLTIVLALYAAAVVGLLIPYRSRAFALGMLVGPMMAIGLVLGALFVICGGLGRS